MPLEDEDRAIEEVVDRLADKFPGVERDIVHQHVEERLETFEGAAVRDFVPVLIEHEVAAELRDPPTSEQGSDG